MVTKMHVSNRIKQDETFKAQNEGLRSELAGFEFKPRINKTSRVSDYVGLCRCLDGYLLYTTVVIFHI